MEREQLKGKQTPGRIVITKDIDSIEAVLHQEYTEQTDSDWSTATIAEHLPGGDEESAANAALYAEAHNAANETGMWPLDMVERIKELESALNVVQSSAKLEAAKPGPTFCEELRDALNMVDHVLSKRP